MVIKDRVNVKDRSMRTDQNSKHSSPPCNALQVIYESWQDSHTREVDAFVKRDPRIWQFIASAILLSLFGCGKSDQQQAPPPEVQVVQVEQKDVPIYSEWVGTLEGFVNAQIRPQVTGYLLRQTYQEGSL